MCLIHENTRTPCSPLRTGSQLGTCDLFKDLGLMRCWVRQCRCSASQIFTSRRGTALKLITFHEKNNEPRKHSLAGICVWGKGTQGHLGETGSARAALAGALDQEPQEGHITEGIQNFEGSSSADRLPWKARPRLKADPASRHRHRDK